MARRRCCRYICSHLGCKGCELDPPAETCLHPTPRSMMPRMVPLARHRGFVRSVSTETSCSQCKEITRTLPGLATVSGPQRCLCQGHQRRNRQRCLCRLPRWRNPPARLRRVRRLRGWSLPVRCRRSSSSEHTARPRHRHQRALQDLRPYRPRACLQNTSRCRPVTMPWWA